ncbi:flippase [Ruminococcus sp. AF25-17]|nr:flippase [Ruminococcus sp. AF25-17]
MKIHSVKFNFIMNFIMSASSIVFPLITFPYISRVLMATGNGKVATASAVVAYFNMFASLGIPTYGIRACAKVRDDKKALSKTAQELIIINSITMLISCVVFAFTVILVPEFAAEKELYLINGIGLALNVFAVTWLYNALEQYAYITVINMITKLFSLILMFLLIKRPEDYVIYGGITVFASSASYVFNFIYARKFITLKKIGKYNFRVHMTPIFKFFAMSAAISVYTNLDVVMLQFMQGDAEVGYYNAAIKVKTILVTLITSLGTVLLPRLSYYVKKEKTEDFYRMIGKAVNFVVVAGLPLTIYFMLYASESIQFLAGDGYQGAVLPMIILMPTVLLIGMSNITGIQILTPQNQEQKVLNSIVCGAVADFLLNLVLIPKMASSGAALATVIAELVVLLVQCVYLKEILKDIMRDVSGMKIGAAIVVATIGGSLVKGLLDLESSGWSMEIQSFVMLAISACVFFGTYGVVLLMTKEKLVWDIVGNYIEKK